MEATARIWPFFALRAIWNVDLTYLPGADALLIRTVCGDECHLPLDAYPTADAVQRLGFAFKTRHRKE
jgi:hypothetical protein